MNLLRGQRLKGRLDKLYLKVNLVFHALRYISPMLCFTIVAIFAMNEVFPLPASATINRGPGGELGFHVFDR